MKSPEGIIRHNNTIKEGNLNQRRPFLNIKETTRGDWFKNKIYSLV